MEKTIFDYENYKDYLNDFIASRPHAGRGERSKIAAALRCHLTYISQVLNGPAHFSSEQIDILNSYLGHSTEESDQLFLLLHYGRAGTQSLQAYYKRKLQEVIERRLVLKTRLTYKKTLSPQDQAIYYSSWHYTAVHFATTIPRLNTREQIAGYLGMPPQRVTEILEFLVSVALVALDKGKYKATESSIHLGSDSPVISKHHTNWRMRAIHSLDRFQNDDLHYSSVVTISKADALRIKSALVSAIENVRAIVRASPEEELYCYNVDFLRVAD